MAPGFIAVYLLCILHVTLGNNLPDKYPSDVVELTRTLVSIPSPSGQEQDVFSYAHRWLLAKNFTIVEQPIAPLSPSREPRSNLLAHMPGASPSSLSLVFSTHLDTVPGTVPENGGQEQRQQHSGSKSRLYGRGSVDAKGQAAAMLLATAALRDPGVGLLLVCGEESDHAGMKAANALGMSNFTMVNGEPTDNLVALRQKGMIKARLVASGHAVHSGYPHLGRSAIHALLDALHDIRAQEWGEGVTVNVGVISGGRAPNVVADHAEAVVMWRIVFTVEPTLALARSIVERHPHVQLETITANDALEFHAPPELAVAIGNTTVAYNTDVPYYQGYLFRAVLFGAGSIHQAHTKDEYIVIDELRRLPDLHVKIAQSLIRDAQPDSCKLDKADDNDGGGLQCPGSKV